MTIFKKNTTQLFRVFFLLFILSLIGLLWQHSRKQSNIIKVEGGHITEGIVGTPRFINPVLAQTQADLDLTRLLFTPIVNVDRDGNTFYHLAENIESSVDGLQYTLHLRKDIYFSDDIKLTADDVLFTIESIQDPLIKSPLAAQWQGVVAEKVDQYTVLFKLARPFNDFIYNLEIGVLPEHIWENIEPQEFIFSIYNTTPIGTGPYKVNKMQKTENGIPQKYSLSKNRNALESSYIQTVTILFFDNEELLLQALKKNKIDAAYGISPEHVNNLDDTVTIHSGSLPRVFAIFFNQEKQPLLKSQNIREAINHGINKTALTDTIFQGHALPINSSFGFQSPNIHDPEKSHKLIQDEGWTQNIKGMYEKTINNKTEVLQFSIAVPNLEDMQQIANMIKKDLAEIGINVIIRSYDQGNLNQNIMRPREYEALLFGYEIEKPTDMYAFWHSSQTTDPGINMSLLKNTKVDNILADIRSGKQFDLQQLDREITKTTPAVFLYSPSYIYILPKNINNARFSISESSDRFNTIRDWYTNTRRVWSLFIEKE